MEKKELTREDFVRWGKQSTGPSKMKKKPREYFVEIGKKGAKARKLKRNTPVDNSPLHSKGGVLYS